MAKAKPQKSKPRRQQHQVKKQGKEGDLSQFRAQLDALGLKIIQVTADGNCLFRALADQLEGSEDEYGKYRSMVVQYIVKNREMFEPFIEDDVPFDEYCKSMESDGTWAGHMELQAASLVTRCNICIHRNLSPRWYIRNFEDAGTRMIHLSYHDGEHYNSVRLKEDTCGGPARPVVIKADANLSASTKQAKATSSKSKNRTDMRNVDAAAIKLVMAGSGCDNAEKAEQVLLQVDGDVDVAIEFLIAEQGSEILVDDDSQTPSADTPLGDRLTESTEHLMEESKEKADEQEPSNCNNIKRVHTEHSSQPDDKQKISRNQMCPCGSKKKYKACCGTITGKSAARLLANQTVESKKGRKERKNCRRPSEADTGEPDVGALCI
ncbi:PREDICTED: OTU domain-containing protein 3 isoform X3 [Tarenaya hassleriana]|uniref:OTU domain-containing protein 3 isoform X3 n=1 Tax=Tarenaya hassleriana TaxID=28532 RepID=UPI00053C1D4A|nr:PREDICTED: OTU domain-containing protein 3 isoform X3 [Tarenaya hassleriana]